MYEIHVYDGAVVLQRVGMNEKSKDDGLSRMRPATMKLQDRTPAVPTAAVADPPPSPIMDINSSTPQNHLPHTLQFPDGTSVGELRGWRTVLSKVAIWLYENGHVKHVSQSRLLRTEAASNHTTLKLGTGLHVFLNLQTNIY